MKNKKKNNNKKKKAARGGLREIWTNFRPPPEAGGDYAKNMNIFITNTIHCIVRGAARARARASRAALVHPPTHCPLGADCF